MAVRKRRFAKVGINQALIMDAGIASLIVQLAPGLVNQYLFSSSPLTGQASTLAGVGAAYLYGMLMKNQNVANIGIALGAVDFVKPFIQQLLPASGVNDYAQLNDYGTLNEYTSDPSKRLSLVQYADAY
jgi:hypothetical protein